MADLCRSFLVPNTKHESSVLTDNKRESSFKLSFLTDIYPQVVKQNEALEKNMSSETRILQL